jgi:hypothetical protein
MSSYIVTATLRGVAQTSAEVLGEAYGKEYATIEAAELVAEDLQDSISDYGLEPETEYTVELEDDSPDEEPDEDEEECTGSESVIEDGWGDVSDAYPVPELADEKRAAWLEAEEAWRVAARDGDLDECSRIENEWGDDPATQQLRTAMVLEDEDSI